MFLETCSTNTLLVMRPKETKFTLLKKMAGHQDQRRDCSDRGTFEPEAKVIKVLQKRYEGTHSNRRGHFLQLKDPHQCSSQSPSSLMEELTAGSVTELTFGPVKQMRLISTFILVFTITHELPHSNLNLSHSIENQ
eukprot:Blabericola_migrator_1__1355@NODE_1351_length_4742_cov_13_507166_g669_i2_p4_GENE_NODE_1351_length_4742_cov_13_507166_g669_i2NODE_1351_length_4742_cov_13_507166_g669_i2_p4_ORF_typecomplete_len136_score12_44DUF1759/PF03564_15/0_021_NODE_1351_length_4742_cov_13_507166_g669_i242994706